MLQMAKRRRPRKGEDPSLIYWLDDMERRLRLQEYCRRDVEIERELFKRLSPLSADEQALWRLDATINMRGFHVDRALAEAARQIVETEQQNINTKITELTGGAVTTIDQVARIKEFVNGKGHNVTTLSKRGVAAVLSKAPDGDAKTVLELRRDGGKASARKLDTLLASIDADDRVRGCFKFHGASTGRWSGQRFQPQNLAKEPKDNIAAVIEAILGGDLERLSELGAPLQMVGSISRALITAPPGHVLVGADFSAIESRVLAWLSGETWKLDTYRRFDETGDPALEPYCVTASRILKRTVTPQDEAGRQIGKTCDLAFGFGGGLGAWRRFDTSNTYTDAQVESFKTEWRTQRAATVRFWKSLESMLHRAINTGKRITGKNLAAEFIDGNLYLTLPSDRRLAYPEARLEPGKFDQPQIVFKDNAKGCFNDQRGWFGTFTENVVQAVARDLLAAAMVRLEANGFQIVLHVHDEAVAEVPEGSSAEDFRRLMTELPAWATGLPIAAKAWTGRCYSKQQPAVSQLPAPTVSSSASVPTHTVVVDAPKLNGHAIITPAQSDFTQIPLTAVIGQPLRDGKICCPFHADKTPSLHIYADHFHCFGCGARGDHIDWLMMTQGVARDEALRALASWDGRIATPQIADDGKAERTLASAQRIWDLAKPITGTRAERYLRDVRRIDIDMLPAGDDALRFHPHCPFGLETLPCLIAQYRDLLTDEFAGIHRIALTKDVFAGAKVQRRTLGSWPTPRAIKLWPAADQLFLGEGIETVLAAATYFSMRPAWAAINAGNVAKFPVLAGVEQLTLLVDHDTEGQRCADECWQRWRAAKRDVTQLQPDRPGADFNDLVLEQCGAPR